MTEIPGLAPTQASTTQERSGPRTPRSLRVPVAMAAVVAEQRGAEFNARSDDNQTALITAATLGRVDVVWELLAHGADIHVRAKDGQTALGRAHSSHAQEKAEARQELIRLLEQAGARE